MPMQNQPTIIVADDDSNYRLIGRKALEMMRFRVLEAENGFQAISYLEQEEIDLVLLDAMMPEKDGFMVCQEMRMNPSWKPIPVLISTGLDDIQTINKAFEAGAMDICIKPINWLILGKRIQFILRSTQNFHEMVKTHLDDLSEIYDLPQLTDTHSKKSIDFGAVEWIKGIRSLERIVGEEVFQSFIKNFLNEFSAKLVSLKLASDEQNFEKIRNDILDLKTKTSNLDLSKILSMCGQLEQTCESGDWHKAPEQIQTVEIEFHRIKQILTDVMNQPIVEV